MPCLSAAAAAAACPKGKTSKSAVPEACKGLVLHCKRIYARTEAKPPPPVPAQVRQQQRKQQITQAGHPRTFWHKCDCSSLLSLQAD
jgi:hypothetical protein